MGIIPVTSEEIKKFNKIAIEQTGGELGIVNHSVSQDCSDLLTNQFFGVEQYVGVFRKAAALMECISLRHGFLDGNKRTALIAVEEFLFRNGWIFSPDTKTTEISIKTAKGELTIEELEIWLKNFSKPKI
jgi:death-on-curing protein